MLNSAKNRARLDRMAISLSALCAVHCVATIVILGSLSSLGHIFTAPIIHEAGLALAILLGAVALGGGAIRHRAIGPLVIGGLGLVLMASALFVPHGVWEAFLTVAGVLLVGIAHFLNMRANSCLNCLC